MAWTATLAKETRPDGSKIVALTYTDGQATITDRFDVQGNMDANFIARKVRDRIAYLNLQDTSFTALTAGAVTPAANDPVIVPPTPTPADIAKAQYLADLGKLQKMQLRVSLGMLRVTDPEYSTQLALVISEFKPEYEA